MRDDRERAALIYFFFYAHFITRLKGAAASP
jgi:hypothetical protein